VIVPYHLRSEAPPYARPISYSNCLKKKKSCAGKRDDAKGQYAPQQAIENTIWRQQQCINLIPSRTNASPMTRLLSIMDPGLRYAEHKPVKAFDDAEVFLLSGHQNSSARWKRC
jgi:aminomethyltransferase